MWYDGVESGVDNNPAVSDKPSEVTEGVDSTVLPLPGVLALAVLAGKLGKRDRCGQVQGRAAEALAGSCPEKMWSEPDGMFLNIDAAAAAGAVKTWTNFVPLWAGIATPEQAKRMINEHVLNPKEFWCDYGIRTLAPRRALYNPKSGYWRGPVWVISNYLVMHGL